MRDGQSSHVHLIYLALDFHDGMDHVLTCLNPSKHLQHQLSRCRPMNVMKVAKRPRHLGSTFWVKMVKVWARGCSQQDRMPFKPMISDIACWIKAKSRVFFVASIMSSPIEAPFLSAKSWEKSADFPMPRRSNAGRPLASTGQPCLSAAWELMGT